MKLLDIQYRNFKGIKSFRLTPGGKSVTVYGENGLGKTSLYDGLTYLFFGNDSLGQGDFGIKPIGMVGTELAPIQCEVSATFTNPVTGGETTLKKILVEKWVKQRGKAFKEMTGHETEFYVDDVPVKMGEYKTKVAEITAKEAVFKLLTNPGHFNNKLKMAERRALLFEMCGTMSDEQIISSSPELADLPGILQGKIADDYKKTVMARRKTINESIAKLPARVDEVMRSKQDVDTSKKIFLQSNLDNLRLKLGEKNNEIVKIKNGGGIQIVQANIRDTEQKIAGLRSVLEQERSKDISLKQDEISASKRTESDIAQRIKISTINHGIAVSDQKHISEATEALRDEYALQDGKEFDGCNCPFCAQVLPTEKLEELRAAFNLDKAKKLTAIIEKGEANKKRLAELAEEIVNLAGQINADNILLSASKLRISEQETELAKLKEAAATPPTSPEIEKLNAQVKAFNDELTILQTGTQPILDKLDIEVNEINEQITAKEQAIAVIDAAVKADERLAELTAEKKTLAAQFEESERHLFLIETFIRLKASLLEDNINSRFRIVKFRLFRDQINGGLEEICEAEVNGVPYSDLNHAARVHADLDIINTFGDHYGFHPVVFIDGKESVTELPEMQCQVICLQVSEADKVLRIVSE